MKVDYIDRREQLLKATLKQFLQSGIRRVKISDLTRDLGISSKTIYHLFGTKDMLVRECFRLYLTNSEKDFRHWQAQSPDVATLLINFYHSALHSLERANPDFFTDLAIHYGNIWNGEKAFGLTQAKEIIRQGMEERIFVSHLDQHLCAHTLTHLLRLMLEKETYREVSPEEQFTAVIWPYVRGLCTPEGREAFRKAREHGKLGNKE